MCTLVAVHRDINRHRLAPAQKLGLLTLLSKLTGQCRFIERLWSPMNALIFKGVRENR